MVTCKDFSIVRLNRFEKTKKSVLFVTETSTQRCSIKGVVLIFCTKFTEKCLCLSCRPQAYNFIKKRNVAQALSCELYDIFKNTYVAKHLQMAAYVTFYQVCWMLCYENALFHQICKDQPHQIFKSIFIIFVNFCNHLKGQSIANIYLFKVNNINITKRYEIC